jgi:hypothetical protein
MNRVNCVRFSEEGITGSNIISSLREEDDLYDTWLSPEDFKLIRFESQVIAKESQRSGMVSLLELTITRIEDNPLEAAESLTLWAMHAHSRRGLESQISSLLKQHRKGVQRKVRASVMSLQDQLRLMNWSLEDKANMIADVYMRDTKLSKELAAAMGKADMKAATTKSNSVLIMNATSKRHQHSAPEYSPTSTLDIDLS